MSRKLIRQVRKGMIFGRWRVLGYSTTVNGRKYAYCLCQCGTEEVVACDNLLSGASKSCGCLRRELLKERKTVHGAANEDGYIYRQWRSAMARCYNEENPGFNNYGGRGIRVYKPWRENFLAYEAYILGTLGERPTPQHSIDRIDNNGDYWPGNLRWATRSEQGRNRRSNILLTMDGKTQTLTAWAEEYGVPYARVADRVRRVGWTLRDALTIPPHGRRRKKR